MAPYMNRFTLLQTISLVYLLVTVTCTGSSLRHDEECIALFQLKQSMFNQNDPACVTNWFHMFDSWKPRSNASYAGFDCCSWFGVECSNDGHVISLDLSEGFLCGHINSNNTLFSLVHLQMLNLAWNNFDESQIPSEVGRLKQLTSLNLSDNLFSGEIPLEISQLTHLSSLDLSWNPLKLQGSSGLKNLVKNLTRLEELDLSMVDISSSVPHLLANFSSIRSIILQGCSLQNEFPATIFELPQLKILNVAKNINLTGSFPRFRSYSLLEHVNLDSTGFFGTVPESISNLKHLKILRLSDCSFSERIPGSLSNMTQLTYLALRGNGFTNFVPSLVSLSKLNSLVLDDSQFEKGCIPKWLGKLTELKELSLSNMNINSEIPPFLANLTHLTFVNMKYNSLIGHIPSSLFNLNRLTYLNLEDNQLEGSISSSISNFQDLRYLNLASNHFNGRVDLDTFMGLNKLESLFLGYNNISLVDTNNYTNTPLPKLKHLALATCNLKEFPAFLRFQNKMEIILLDKNKIDGMVPVWIWNNSQETLQVIDLSSNSITGFHRHPHLLPWRRIEEIFIYGNQIHGRMPIPPQTTVAYDVSGNRLTGEIPTLICELKSLRLLALSSNYMSGTLPPCFGILSNSLMALALNNNYFHGTMMDMFVHGSLLEDISLSGNQFTGQLPRSLKNCTNLEILSLEDNSFDDVFPSWLGNLPKLHVLLLRSNKFYGSIGGPSTVSSQFPKLHIIDLSNNHFSGQLPQNYFQTWTAMKSVGESNTLASNMTLGSSSFIIAMFYAIIIIHKGVTTEFDRILTINMAIDLSCNHFEGDIPVSLGDLRGIQSLNLSNNHFTGRVLSSLGYLKNLESLDLSGNELSGEIPQQLMQLGFLSIFNVSFNHLVGRIPHGKQFDTFEKSSYIGNSRLCGQPISEDCEGSKAPRLLPTTNTSESDSESESLFPSKRIDWIIVVCGVGSGLVVGIVFGNFLYERYSDRFKKRKDRWVRPLSNTRRHKGGVTSSSLKGKEKV